MLWLTATAVLGRQADELPPEPPPSVAERVKAAYLVRFAQYASWPDDTFDDAEQPVRICVLGHDPFGSILDQTAAGHTSDGRPLHIERRTIPDGAGDCQVVFIAAEEADRLGDLLGPLLERPILTVGQSDDFLRLGGGVNLVLNARRVRFEVDLDNTSRAGVRLPSTMLTSALRVLRAKAPTRRRPRD